MSILDAAQSGDRRATLVAMRDKLAAEMDAAPAAVVAQVAGRLSAVLLEIEDLGSARKVSTLDELDRRRKDRLAAADVSASSDRPKRQRRS